MKFNRPLFRIIGFLIIFSIFFAYTTQVFTRKWGYQAQTTIFYQQPEDSIDVLFLGASGFDWGVSPLILWEETGVTSYVRAIGATTSSMIYYYFLESLKYQNPDIVVLDAYHLVRYWNIDDNEPSYRRSFEPLDFSLIKLKALFDISKNSDFDTFISLLFPFFRYHSRWSELSKNDFVKTDNPEDLIFKGQFIGFEKYEIDYSDEFMAETNEAKGISEESRDYYEKIIEICNEKGIHVVLMSMPRLATADYAEYNAVKTYAEENKLIFVDYNLPELMNAVGFEPEKEMIDSGHINTCGAQKFSSHFAQILAENYSLDDKRNDPKFEIWDRDAAHLRALLDENCN